MPIVGAGLHVLIAIFFAIDAVRRGQPLYWLFILFAFPLLGSAVYFFAIFLPNSRLERGARKTVAQVAHMLDPGRELREAQEALNDAPTAQNQMRLAAALLGAGRAADALVEYEKSLSGPFANDPEILWGAARAAHESERHTKALDLLQRLGEARTDYRAQEVAILRAKALAACGQSTQARTAFEDAEQRFGSFDVKAEYLIWALLSREASTVQRLAPEVDRMSARWSAQTRDLNAQLLGRLKAAHAQLKQ
jgi:hypothetical protein